MRVCSDAVSAHDTNSPSHTTRRVAPCAHPRASGRIRTGPTCTTTAAVTPGWVRSLGRRHLGGAGSVCGLSSVRMKRCARPHAASSVQRTPPTWMGSAGRAWVHNAAGLQGCRLLCSVWLDFTTAILTMARHVLELVEQVCEAERLGGLRVLAVGLLGLLRGVRPRVRPRVRGGRGRGEAEGEGWGDRGARGRGCRRR